jgi:TonB-linked SusC/RagA family outer membrane protein
MKSKLLLALFLLFAGIGSLFAQKVITGTVTDNSDGSVIPGVNVVVKGTSVGTTTDVNGTYSINVPERAKVLVFSFVGMVTKEVEIGNQTKIDVALEQSSLQLNEVVVTSLGISREKKALGYSVTQISGKDVSTVKESNMINSLSGRVAGVVLTQSPTGPGGGTRVVIRGNNSITGNNQPLYVVDGIPVENSGVGSANGSGTANYRRDDYGTGISDINPDDIESVTVLKGPNAAALYGSRASNGAILITTKKGKVEKGIGVTFTSSSTFDTPLLLPHYQNEYGQGSDGNTYDNLDNLRSHGGSWGAKMDGSDQLYWTGETRPYVAQPNNVKDFFRTGSNLVNTLALEGGDAKSNLRFSYTNNKANSILPNAGLKRNNFNLRAISHLSKKLTVDAKVTYFTQTADQRPFQGTEGIMAYLYNIPRNLDINDLKDFQNADYSVRTYTNGSNGNPYWIENHDINHDTRNRIVGFAKATYQINDWLSAFVRVGTDYLSQKIERVNQFGHWYFPKGQFNFKRYNTSETNGDFLLMLKKDLTSDLKITANFGGNMRVNTFEYIGIFGEDFKIPTKATVASARNTVPSYTPLREKKVNSLYGTATVSYRDFLYLDVTGRNDWSSTLPESNWSYFYPSVSLSALLNNFIDPDETVLDLLKVRASWAQVGGDTEPYQLDLAYDLSQNGYLGLTTLSRPSVKLNPDLRPEQTKSSELGIEFRLFKNKLYGNASYYNIKSTDLIMDVPVSASTGYAFFRSNVGQMTNKGWELMIGGQPLSMSGFTWNVSFNISHNKNQLDDLIEGLDHYIFSTNNSGNVVVQATVGGEYGEIYGTDWLKNENGDLVVDAQGRPMATSDKVLLGNYQPDFVGGLSNTFQYKGITLNALIDARIGGQLFSGTDASLDANGVSDRTLKYRDGGVTLDAVTNTGTAEAPVWSKNTTNITAEQYWGAASGIAANYVYDQTFLMLRELSLSYSIPKNLIKNTFIQSASVGIIGRNLGFLYKKMDNFDPISSYSTSNFAQGMLYFTLPTTRSIGFNVNIKF